MRIVAQNIDDIVESLRPIAVDWQDDVARNVIERLLQIPIRSSYSASDLHALLNEDFNQGILIVRLLLGLSKDAFDAQLKATLGQGGSGVTRYRRDPDTFIQTLIDFGVLDVMALEINRIPHWSDVLVERLRSGRGSAISGQRRGKELEDQVETIVRNVFGDQYTTRCNFVGVKGEFAKCDFAIPGKNSPYIVIESKGYGATGSKMTDVIGDIEKIIAAKRQDTALLFVTDGIPWRNRLSDLRKIVEYQNQGFITRIYTLTMARQFEVDLRILKQEFHL